MGVPLHWGLHILGDGIFSVRTSLAVRGSLGQVLMWPFISISASFRSCVYIPLCVSAELLEIKLPTSGQVLTCNPRKDFGTTLDAMGETIGSPMVSFCPLEGSLLVMVKGKLS